MVLSLQQEGGRRMLLASNRAFRLTRDKSHGGSFA